MVFGQQITILWLMPLTPQQTLLKNGIAHTQENLPCSHLLLKRRVSTGRRFAELTQPLVIATWFAAAHQLRASLKNDLL
jgi:hypothetical protein